jgi:hypothetical protein
MYSTPSHNTTAMAAGPSTQQPNGVKFTEENTTQMQYEKILHLREEVFAGKHPRLKVPIQLHTETSKLPMKPPSTMPTSQMRNGAHNHAQKSHLQVTQTKFAESKDSRSPVSTSNPFHYRPPNPKSVPTSGPSPAAIDPIFLTKSEVLVKAELQQKRQRIERALEEQLNQTKMVSRLKTFDQEAIPEFDVAEVLRKAQEIVKPFKPTESNAANCTASSSDSLDENTFYSSQMNESTTEEADEQARLRPNKPCKYFVDGNCHFGDDCTFSHDVLLKQNVAIDASEAMNIDSINADEQANSKRSDTSVKPQTNGHHDPNPQSHLDRIAELEEQLRQLKSQGGGGPPAVPNNNPSKHRNIQEEPAYTPPSARDLAVNQHGGHEEFFGRKDTEQRRSSTNVPNSDREYARHNQKPQSPSSNEVRVIRNHITSPIAPQPARVSPLAVAKVPQISQGISILHNDDRPSRGSGGDSGGVRQIPRTFLQPAGSRKRRREPDSYDKARHVLGRRNVVSPEVRIKAEPVSPPLYPASAEVLQPRRRQEVSRPIYIDSDSPRPGDREPILYQSNSVDRLTQAYASNERRPLTPVARRIISRNFPHLDAHEGQDLRRVVSARQLRVPRSPLEQYAAPHLSSTRAASHVYIPQPAQVLSRQPRASVQPLSISRSDHDRSFSPLPRSNISPTNPEPISMAPPRRIVIDQYGQRYFEAPLVSDRQASVIPLGRANEFVSQYEPPLARSTSIRDSQPVEVYDERQYRRRAPSPLSPRYVQYHATPKSRQIFDGDNGQFYGEETYIPRANEVQMMNHPESRSFDQFDDVGRPQEILQRTQSVRPVSGQFEDSREHISRVQSVRPEQERVINLERRQEVTPQRISQVSIRDDDPFSRSGRGVIERPKYQYAPEVQERRYVEEFRHDDVVFEAPLTSGRRPL